jgi:hypothetical protein
VKIIFYRDQTPFQRKLLFIERYLEERNTFKMRVSTYSTASALAALAAAQTFSDCNPMEKACPNNPAMPKTWETDFTAGKDAVKGWKQTAGSLTYGAEGAEFTVERKGDAPTIGSEGYFHFGYVEVVMKAAPGVGIISSIVLQSDDLDEVDWEWIGGVDSLVQANYFGKGMKLRSML